MITRIGMLCIVVVLLPVAACGQNPPPNATVSRQEFDGLVAKFNELTTAHNEALAQLQQVAQKDIISGKTFVRLDMSHEPTRREVQKAIAASVPQTGTVVIDNRMTTDQVVSVNGVTYDVLALSKRRIEVPLGEFSIRLRGQRAQSRFVGMPFYETIIPIQPAAVSTEPSWRVVEWNYDPMNYFRQ